MTRRLLIHCLDCITYEDNFADPSARQPGDLSTRWPFSLVPVNPATHQSFDSSISYLAINPLACQSFTQRPVNPVIKYFKTFWMKMFHCNTVLNENVTLQHCFEWKCYTATLFWMKMLRCNTVLNENVTLQHCFERKCYTATLFWTRMNRDTP